jgi:hypothetical protein
MDAGQDFYEGFTSVNDSDDDVEEEEEGEILEIQSKPTKDYPRGRSCSCSRMDNQLVPVRPRTLDEAAKKLQEARKKIFYEIRERKATRRSCLTSGRKRKVGQQKTKPGTR